MPWTRHILQSVAIPAVTQVRVSDDYELSNSQWIIGDTTILAHAMGLQWLHSKMYALCVTATPCI